jgi:hypothetical protein
MGERKLERKAKLIDTTLLVATDCLCCERHHLFGVIVNHGSEMYDLVV